MKRLLKHLQLSTLCAYLVMLAVNNPVQAQVPDEYFTWNNTTVYFLLTDRFNNGDVTNDVNYNRTPDPVAGFLGGDLEGITEKITEGYFDSLGVNAIWFTAPYEQIHGAVPGYWCGNYPCAGQSHYGYHGYYPLDFTELDANMGTTTDLTAFVDSAHAHGIRVIMDIVLNHVGYETLADANEFGFGPIGDPWQDPNTGLDPLGMDWCNWWTDANGDAWIRKGEDMEYCSPAQGGDDLTLALAGLPDIRTDLTTPVDLPNILLTKWDATKEAAETAELNTFFTDTGLSRTPANYIIKWLTDWVREYGIDGFRIDTYKHVEREVWGRLHDQAQDAFMDWKTANPGKVLDNQEFWLVGEWFGHGPNRNEEAVTIGKTDALINFNFKGQAGTPTNIDATYSSYSDIVTSNPDWTFLNYVSSHDDGMFDRNDLIDAGTSLLLAPGNAQIYYGDETQRMLGTSNSDQDTRSFMNWGSINTTILEHWKRLGQFRKTHPSLGAGEHVQLSSTPYTFYRTYQGAGFQDLALCVVGATGSTTIDVSTLFTDGTELRDFYTRTEATVANGQITFNADVNGVILIEEVNPIPRPTLSMNPPTNTFDPTSIMVTITAMDVSDPNPVIYYTTNPNLPTNDLSGWTVYTAPFTLSATANVRTIAVNSSGGQSTVLDHDYYVGSIPGFTVYFKKPASWGSTVNIHYFDQVPAAAPTTWPGVTMTQCGDWWEYELSGIISTGLIFNDGSAQTADLFRDSEGYYDGNTGIWTDTPPMGFDCTCPADVDMDGVCATVDCDDNNPNVPTTPGTACDDGNGSTSNDQIQEDGCTCAGCPTDADLDGICANEDCDDNDSSVPAAPGTACDDGNANTTNDQILADGCTCAGAGSFTVYFKKPAGWASTMKVHYWDRQPGDDASVWPGVDMAQCSIDTDWWYFTFTGTSGTNLIFNDGAGQQTADLSRSADGWYDGAWSDGAPFGFGCDNCTTDVDMDGVCADVDCDDNNPGLPLAPGTSCDDGDAGTSNDQILADGCTCAGSTSFTVYFKKPAGWATPVKVHYWNRQPGSTASTWPGVDMTQCPTNAEWWLYTFTGTSSTNLLFHDNTGQQTADLSRSTDGWYDGGWLATPPNAFTCNSCTTDVDMDGVCAETDCDDNNSSVPAPPGTACDDGNVNTSNDQIQDDGCTCTGYSDFTVYFKKPATWATPVKIHYWDRLPNSTATTWPGTDMALCGNDWWSYTFTATESTNLLFHDNNGNQTADLSRNSEGWYDDGWSANGSCTAGGVTVIPAIPTTEELVTITFDATGTPLAAASKVYYHSGVSITENDATSFDYAIGNWGEDDGVGEMTNMGGNVWEIQLPTLRTYYNVPVTEDIFGLNFLFRSADGTTIENNGGANYFNPVNTGSHFTIVSPEASPHLLPLNSSFNLESNANTAPNDWLMEEVDDQDNVIAVIGTQTSGDNYSENILLNTTALRRFKITANFTGGAKYKYFEAMGYSPVCTTARPGGVEPGINYDPTDPTKAILVLHTPTYTRFLKGTGVEVGTPLQSTPKNIVHLLGDFNNWTLDANYQMCRDTDGWNGMTDSDADGDRGDYWWIELTGLTPGQEYVFQYAVDGNLQVADPYAEKISDFDDGDIDDEIYPNLIAYPDDAADNRRASVLQTDQADFVWTAPAFTRPTTNNLNIYELHFRDFTEEGTYLAAIDRLDYIKALGINAIHVMPVSEFEGNSSWGYNPNFYFAADKAYGTKENLKTFIDECHKREIQVFNDVVLNHAFYSNVMARLFWNEIDIQPADDNPWFNPEHKAVAEPAGWWGADWNHESEHVQDMIDRILDYWLQEFRFDGFRFDFTKGFTQTAQDPSDPWASSYDQDRIDLLLRMVERMQMDNPGAVAIFEHLANASEDRVLADEGILMWSGAGHHAAIKNFLLGFDQDNPDIQTSGIYYEGGRNFMFANWMSYMESHDEERQAYEVLTYGNTVNNEPNPVLKNEKMVDRLKLGAAFNLLFPGPRMIWELEEIAYDVNINFNGRTGEKPVLWNYYEDPTKRELYRLMSTTFFLRNNFPLYAGPTDYDNIGWGPNAITTPRRMKLDLGDGRYVIVIGNLDPEASHDAFPQYPVTGTWYRHNGDTAIDGTTINVSNAGSSYLLEPNEVLILTNFAVDNPVLDDSKVNVATRVVLGGAYDSDSGLMRDDLRQLGHLPLTEPYTAAGYTFVGGGGEMVDASVFNATGNDAIVDWVILELRDANTPATILASRAALIQRDGDIVDLDGKNTAVSFTGLTAGNYYLSVRHRNHLSATTSQAYFFSEVSWTHDFSSPLKTTWGQNAQKTLDANTLGLWAGDANQDGQINAVDINLFWRPTNGTPFIYGSTPADFNMDGAINAVDQNLYWRPHNSIVEQTP